MCGRENDPFVTYLKSTGYNPIRLPRTNLHPLQLFILTGKELTYLGELGDVFKGPAKIPEISFNNVAAAISGKRTGELSIGVGLSLLGNILAAFGGTKAGIEAQYQQARTAVFEFEKVLEDNVSVALLDQFLNQADVDPNGTHVANLLDADRVLITTACIKSTKFTLDASSSRSGSVSIDVPVIQQVVGVNVKVSPSSSNAAKVTYEGDTPLAFGFKAVQLYFDKGRYTAFKPADAAIVMSFETAMPDGTERWVAPSIFADLK